MSKAGRLQDALWDYLWGYSHGQTGEQYPGPLQKAGMTWEEANVIAKEVENIAWMVLGFREAQ